MKKINNQDDANNVGRISGMSSNEIRAVAERLDVNNLEDTYNASRGIGVSLEVLRMEAKAWDERFGGWKVERSRQVIPSGELPPQGYLTRKLHGPKSQLFKNNPELLEALEAFDLRKDAKPSTGMPAQSLLNPSHKPPKA